MADRIKKPISVIYHFFLNATEQERHLTWREGSGSYRGYKYSRGNVSAARESQKPICCVLSAGFRYTYIHFLFLVEKKNTETKNWEMENWKIPFMVVTFVAFLQTYEAESSVLAEERRPPEHWQVECLFFEFVKNEAQKYQCKLCKYKSFCDLMTRLF